MYFYLCRRQISYAPQPNLFPPPSSSSSIGSQIKALVQQGLYSKSLQLYSSPEAKRLFLHTPTAKFAIPSLLKACASLSDLRHGKTIHSHIFIAGLHFDPFISTSLVNLYSKCGSFTSAHKVFAGMSERENATRDVTLWNSMLDGYFRYGYFDEGMLHFRRMQLLGVRPDAYSLCILLGACEGLLGYRRGKQIHAYIVRNVFNGDPFLETALVDMYSGCGQVMDSWRVFHESTDKSNIAAWNALIGGLCENSLWGNSLELFSLVKSESCTLGSTTFCTTLTACSYGEDADFGRQIHCDVIKTGFQGDPYICTSLLTMYAKCEMVESANRIFRQTPNKQIELWNAMISAYVGTGYVYEALNLYIQMRLGEIAIDSFTISNVLSCCSVAGLYDFGRTVHTEITKRPIQSNVAVQSALVTMYSKCEKIKEANSVFVTMKERDMVAWGSIISGLCQNGELMEALGSFRAMESGGMKPDSDIMASVISACMRSGNIDLGCEVHGYVIKIGLVWDVFVANSLIEMYSKNGFADMAGNVFSDMPHKSLVAWNSIMSCYSQNGLPALSIAIFPQIVEHGLNPDSFSLSIVLLAVSSIAALSKGKTLHGYQIRVEAPSDLLVENALIDMYVKCGSLKYAQKIFNKMTQRSLLTWNSMIAGYGSHGECVKAIGLFDDMTRSGMVPDDVTFLSLISSCSHSGLIEKGLNLFQSMSREYGIEPRIEHYVNVVDLLSRSGCLDDAYDFIQNMPFEPDPSVWLCLLGACQVHRNVELGELAAQNLLRVEPARGSNYVHVSNLYGETGSWDKAGILRVSMKAKGLKKNPGRSWIEVGNRVVSFFSGDSSSQRTSEIYETLSNIRRNMESQRRISEGVLV